MSAKEIIIGTIPAPARLDKALAEATGLSRARVQGLIDEGRVDVAGKTATAASMKVAADTPFRIIIAAAMPAEPAEGFRWETGADGIIRWVEGAPRGALVGQSIAAIAERVRGVAPRAIPVPPVQTRLAGLEPFTMAA